MVTMLASSSLVMRTYVGGRGYRDGCMMYRDGCRRYREGCRNCRDRCWRCWRCRETMVPLVRWPHTYLVVCVVGVGRVI